MFKIARVRELEDLRRPGGDEMTNYGSGRENSNGTIFRKYIHGIENIQN